MTKDSDYHSEVVHYHHEDEYTIHSLTLSLVLILFEGDVAKMNHSEVVCYRHEDECTIHSMTFSLVLAEVRSCVKVKVAVLGSRP